MEQRRLTARKVWIGDLIQGKYVRQEGLLPNYVVLPDGRKVGRAWLSGTVVSKYKSDDGNYSSISLDDSTGVIRAKAFGGMKIFDSIDVGETIDLIGRVREYNSEIHILPEVAHKTGFKTYLLRMLETDREKKKWLSKIKKLEEIKAEASDAEELKRLAFERLGMKPEEVESFLSVDESEDAGPSPKEAVLKLIDELDKGEGAPYSELLEKSGLPEAEFDEIMNSLLEDGLCFEPRPGKIKRL